MCGKSQPSDPRHSFSSFDTKTLNTQYPESVPAYEYDNDDDKHSISTATGQNPIFTPMTSRTSTMTNKPPLFHHPTPSHGGSSSATMLPLEDPFDATPWPDNTYMILEKDTQHAISLTETHGLSLQPVDPVASSPDAGNRWLCVSENNYFGFREVSTGYFLGHKGGSHGVRMHAAVRHCKADEYLIPRRHPRGGYQLLSPAGDGKGKELLIVGAVGKKEERKVVRDRYLSTLWVFVKV